MSSRISRVFYWQLASVSKDISSLYHFNYRSANHSVHGENLIQYLPPNLISQRTKLATESVPLLLLLVPNITHLANLNMSFHRVDDTP